MNAFVVPAHIRAKKQLGQNFLIDESSLEAISNAINISWKCIVEVWPGYWALTEKIIAHTPKRLDLVELDRDMVDILRSRMQQEWNNRDVMLHHMNILDFRPENTPYSVIANIPYYITSPILFKFIHTDDTPNAIISPESMVIMMQKEVGEKILGKSWKKNDYSFLSLALHMACEEISIIAHVPKEHFFPIPKVDSIVLRFILKKNRNIPLEKKLHTLWEASFKFPRKTLYKNLSASGIDTEKIDIVFETLELDRRVRAESIAIDNWIHILSVMNASEVLL